MHRKLRRHHITKNYGMCQEEAYRIGYSWLKVNYTCLSQNNFSFTFNNVTNAHEAVKVIHLL